MHSLGLSRVARSWRPDTKHPGWLLLALPSQTAIKTPRGAGTLPKQTAAKHHRTFWRTLLIVALAGMAVLAAVGAAFIRAQPPVTNAEALVASELAAHHGVSSGFPAPEKVGQAVVAIEDRRFYWTPGFDPISLFQVARSLVMGGPPGGGATIPQQLAKVLYVREDPTVVQKLQVVALALKLDFRYSKAEILDMYLNAIYFGDGNWGIVQASRGYFGKEPNELDWAQASLLAGLPQAPSSYDPARYLELAKQRQRYVLAALVRAGTITQAQSDAAFAEPLHVLPPRRF